MLALLPVRLPLAWAAYGLVRHSVCQGTLITPLVSGMKFQGQTMRSASHTLLLPQLVPWLPHSLSSSHKLLLLLKILNLSSSEAPAVPGARSTLPISAQHYCLALPISVSSLCCICHHLKFSGLGICFFSSIYPLHSFMRACSLSLAAVSPTLAPRLACSGAP